MDCPHICDSRWLTARVSTSVSAPAAEVTTMVTLRFGAIVGLEHREHHLGALDHAGGQAGEPRHLDAVGMIGGARDHLVQKYHLALPFLDAHRGVVKTIELGRECDEFVEMCGE